MGSGRNKPIFLAAVFFIVFLKVKPISILVQEHFGRLIKSDSVLLRVLPCLLGVPFELVVQAHCVNLRLNKESILPITVVIQRNCTSRTPLGRLLPP